MLTPPATAALAVFTGRDQNTFTAFATQALYQSALLFTTITGLTDYPDEPDERLLATQAILEMADYIYQAQPYTAAKATPYSSETIGSYAYTKVSAVAKTQTGQPTGLLWWDLAVDTLATRPVGLVDSGSVTVVDRDMIGLDDSGTRYIPGPADQVLVDYTYVNAELPTRHRIG